MRRTIIKTYRVQELRVKLRLQVPVDSAWVEAGQLLTEVQSISAHYKRGRYAGNLAKLCKDLLLADPRAISIQVIDREGNGELWKLKRLANKAPDGLNTEVTLTVYHNVNSHQICKPDTGEALRVRLDTRRALKTVIEITSERTGGVF